MREFQKITRAQVQAALTYIPSEDRDTWIRVGFSIRAEFGNEGFDLWDAWSRKAPNYEPKAAAASWRSFAGAKGSIATVVAMAKENGWKFTREENPQPYKPDPKIAARRRAEERQLRERRARAKTTAAEIMKHCEIETHEYLEDKGFPDAKMPVLQSNNWEWFAHSGDLIVPLRNERGEIATLQRIKQGGDKKFLAGGETGGMSYRLGRGEALVFVEGLATGLSVRAALREISVRAEIRIAFSCHAVSAQAKRAGRGIVIADSDKGYCTYCKTPVGFPSDACGECKGPYRPGAGIDAAIKSGRKWWSPPELGDANDYHQRHGLEALVRELRGVFR